MSELWRYRDLLRALVARDLKVRYRRSTLGFLWTMLQPLLMMSILTAVFSRAFRFDLPGYPVYALSGILFWNFFSQSVVSSMNSLRANANLLTKVPVPKAVFPLSVVLSGLINFALALLPLSVLLLASGHPLTPALFFLPISITIAGLFTIGAGLLLSPLAAFFNDILELVGVVLMLVMYATPIFYPEAIVPERYHFLFELNPLRAVLELVRAPIYRGEVPAAADVLLGLALALLSLAVGIAAFRAASDKIALHL